jgi:hypothetical protein
MTEEKKVTREELELPWFLQDPTDAYTNIIRPVDHPGKILFTTTQNPLREVRQRAEFVVRACNSHYDLLEALKKIADRAIGDDRSDGIVRMDIYKSCIEAIQKAEQL